MKRNRILPALVLIFTLLLSACASGGSSAADASTLTQPAQDAPAEAEYSGSDDSKLNLGDTADRASGSRVYTDADSKLIRQASVSIQTTDFPAAIAALDELTSSLNGYYEKAKTQGGDYYDANAQRYAAYTVRVPKENCDAFLQAAGNIGHVVSSNESSSDVGDQYYDAELRLKTLRTKQERLLALMEKAERMEDIITLENSLSEVQYEIEQLTSTLKRYDALVDFATIDVAVNEVIRLSGEPGQAAPLGERLGAAFSSGFSSFGMALSNLTVWFAYHFIGVVIFAAAAAAALIITRRALYRRRGKDEPPAQ